MRLVHVAVFAALLAILATGTWPGTVVAGQEPTQTSPPTPERMHQGMMAMRKQMMAERQAAQMRLQTLLDQMSSAEGDARIDAMSALLTELAEQQLAHLQHMEQIMDMMEQMMSGMMHGAAAEPEPQR